MMSCRILVPLNGMLVGFADELTAPVFLAWITLRTPLLLKTVGKTSRYAGLDEGPENGSDIPSGHPWSMSVGIAHMILIWRSIFRIRVYNGILRSWLFQVVKCGKLDKAVKLLTSSSHLWWYVSFEGNYFSNEAWSFQKTACAGQNNDLTEMFMS